jgi:hypothetical protein
MQKTILNMSGSPNGLDGPFFTFCHDMLKSLLKSMNEVKKVSPLF